MIVLRPAVEGDADMLLGWANDPATRAASFHSDPIDRETHLRWLGERLASTSTRLLVGLEADRPVGQVRLEREADGRVEVGISVAAEARGRGVGRSLLAAALAAGISDPAVGGDERRTVFVARIRPDNEPSIALFESLGFRPAGETRWAGVPCLVYELPAAG